MFDRIPFDSEPSAQRCVLASRSGELTVFDLSDDLSSRTIDSDYGPVRAAGFVGRDRVLTVHELGEVSVCSLADDAWGDVCWSADSGIEPAACALHRSTQSVDVALGARDGGVLMLRFTGAAEPTAASAPGHDEAVTAIAFGPSGERLASAGRDRRISVWDVSAVAMPAETVGGSASTSPGTGTENPPPTEADTEGDPGLDHLEPESELTASRSLEGSNGWPLCLAFDPGGDRLLSGGMDNAIYLWDLERSDPLVAVDTHPRNWVAALAWSPDGTRAASGSWDATVTVLEAGDFDAAFELSAHSDVVSSLVFLADPPLLASGGHDGSVALWNWREQTLEGRLEAHSDWIDHLQPLPGGHLLTVSDVGGVERWDLETGTRLARAGLAEGEAFELGRDVDFTDHLDLPDLGSDRAEGGPEPLPEANAVQALEPANSKGESARSTAVGLLDRAVEEIDVDLPASGEDAEPTRAVDPGAAGSPEGESSQIGAAPPVDEEDARALDTEIESALDRRSSGEEGAPGTGDLETDAGEDGSEDEGPDAPPEPTGADAEQRLSELARTADDEEEPDPKS